MSKLLKFRKRIDAIDEKLVKLIYERLEICKDVAIYKSENDIPMMQPERVKEVMAKRRELAEGLGVNPGLIENIYGLIVNEACTLEDEIILSLSQKQDAPIV